MLSIFFHFSSRFLVNDTYPPKIMSSMDPTQNLLLQTDSYKVGHYLQYPPGTTRVLSYFESRGGKYDKVVFFGLQILLKKWLTKPVTMAMIDQAEKFYEKQIFAPEVKVFNREGWEYIVKEHSGYLPLSIKAVPEGWSKIYYPMLATLIKSNFSFQDLWFL